MPIPIPPAAEGPSVEPPARSPDPCLRSSALRPHLPLVRRIAHRLHARLPTDVQLDDLVQAGLLGLDEALGRFDEQAGVPFRFYAARRIEGAMLDALRQSDTLTRQARRHLGQIRDAVQKLEHELGRTPRAKEVANALGWTLQAFHDRMVEGGAAGCRAGDRYLEAIDAAAVDGDEAQPAGQETIDEHADPLTALQHRQRQAALAAAVDVLDERERFLVGKLYVEGLNMTQTAALLGLTPTRISQMNTAVLEKLRRRLRDW